MVGSTEDSVPSVWVQLVDTPRGGDKPLLGQLATTVRHTACLSQVPASEEQQGGGFVFQGLVR